METPALKRSHSCIAPPPRPDTPPPPPQVEAAHKAFKAARPKTPAPPIDAEADAPTDAPTTAKSETPKFPTLAEMEEFNERVKSNSDLLSTMEATLKQQEKQINEFDQLFKTYRAANHPFPPSALGASQEQALVKAESYAAQMRHAAALKAYQVLDAYSTSMFLAAGGNKDTGELPQQFLTEIEGELLAPDMLITKAWEKIQMMEDALAEAKKKEKPQPQ